MSHCSLECVPQKFRSEAHAFGSMDQCLESGDLAPHKTSHRALQRAETLRDQGLTGQSDNGR